MSLLKRFICSHCGSGFYKGPQVQPTPKYCSHTCYTQSNIKQRHMCVICGKPVKRLQSFFCSYSCATKKHGGSGERLYSIWSSMKKRCYNKKCKSFHNYGGKSVTVCSEWMISYISFKTWAQQNGYDEHLTIDRIDSSGNYEPKNCRWIPSSEQSRNRRTCIKYNGLTASEASLKIGKNKSIVRERMKAGWPIEKAFTHPLIPTSQRSYYQKKLKNGEFDV